MHQSQSQSKRGRDNCSSDSCARAIHGFLSKLWCQRASQAIGSVGCSPKWSRLASCRYESSLALPSAGFPRRELNIADQLPRPKIFRIANGEKMWSRSTKRLEALSLPLIMRRVQPNEALRQQLIVQIDSLLRYSRDRCRTRFVLILFSYGAIG